MGCLSAALKNQPSAPSKGRNHTVDAAGNAHHCFERRDCGDSTFAWGNELAGRGLRNQSRCSLTALRTKGGLFPADTCAGQAELFTRCPSGLSDKNFRQSGSLVGYHAILLILSGVPLGAPDFNPRLTPYQHHISTPTNSLLTAFWRTRG